MLGSDLLAEEGRLLKRNGGDGRIIGEVVPLPHRLIFDEGSVFLEQTSMITLLRFSYTVTNHEGIVPTYKMLREHFVISAHKRKTLRASRVPYGLAVYCDANSVVAVKDCIQVCQAGSL